MHHPSDKECCGRCLCYHITNTCDTTEDKEEWSSEEDFPSPSENNGKWFTVTAGIADVDFILTPEETKLILENKQKNKYWCEMHRKHEEEQARIEKQIIYECFENPLPPEYENVLSQYFTEEEIQEQSLEFILEKRRLMQLHYDIKQRNQILKKLKFVFIHHWTRHCTSNYNLVRGDRQYDILSITECDE